MDNCVRRGFVIGGLGVTTGIANSDKNPSQNLLNPFLHVPFRVGQQCIQLKLRFVASKSLPDECGAIAIKTSAISQHIG